MAGDFQKMDDDGQRREYREGAITASPGSSRRRLLALATHWPSIFPFPPFRISTLPVLRGFVRSQSADFSSTGADFNFGASFHLFRYPHRPAPANPVEFVPTRVDDR